MDNLTPSQRSQAMQAVKSRDTSPELLVRKLCRDLGERGYRLHRTDLPGRPDVAFIGRRLAILVHGCFWHGHDCPAGAKSPKTNTEYWKRKIQRNRERDDRSQQALKKMGWRTLLIWECEIKRDAGTYVMRKLRNFFKKSYKADQLK